MDEPIKKVTKNYVDNDRFLELLEKCPSKKEIPEELGEIFMLMAKNVAYSRQFINYSESWKSAMISDALLNCCRYVKTFKPEKGVNPFAYYTSVIRNAFINRIKIEKLKRVNDDIVRDHVFNSFCQEYRIHAGVDISKTEDCDFLIKENHSDE